MKYNTKHNFESDVLKLLGLADKHVIWLELRLAYNATPTVRCEFEKYVDDRMLVRDGNIVTEKKHYKVILEEIKEG